MSVKKIYQEIAQRYIESAKQLVAANSEIQEVIGFLVYHALESISCAVIVHCKSSIPMNHETKLNMFLRFCKRYFSDVLNIKKIATVISRINNYGYREKFLYPEFQCPPKPSNSNQKPNQLPPSNSARDFLEDYLNDVVNKGNYGYGYWCKSSKDLVSRLYSPRNYQILDVYDYSNIASAVVRIDSSTKGGFAVTQNWDFSLHQEAGKWCLALIMEK
jgi:hypothetical protein